jgi:hypothetical protein
MKTHTVRTCNKRVDGQYLLTYRLGASTYTALSPIELPEGASIIVEGGKARRP